MNSKRNAFLAFIEKDKEIMLIFFGITAEFLALCPS